MTHPHTPAITLRRLALLWRFYTPALRIQLPLACATLLLGYILCLLAAESIAADPDENALAVAGYSMATLITALPYYTGPLVFAFARRSRAPITTLPASWQEKAIFMLAYTFIIFPLILVALWYGAMAIASLFTPCADVSDIVNNAIHANLPRITFERLASTSTLASYSGNLFTAAAGCLAIAASRRSRLARGIIAELAAMFVLWITGLILGIYASIHTEIVTRAVEGQPAGAVVDDFSDMLISVMPYVSAASIALFIIFSILTAYTIKTRQN